MNSRMIRYILPLLMLITGGVAWGAPLVQDEDGWYIIGSADDYRELMNNSAYWSGGNKFKQVLDIDFGGATLTPIGNKKDVTFRGVYDGRGHTLQNAKLDWTVVDENNRFIGLFGILYGTGDSKAGVSRVCNLTIKNIEVTRTGTGSIADTDLKLGILAGQITRWAAIYDVAIVNCRINDGGHPITAQKSLMVGGVAGGIAQAPDGTSAMTSNNFQLRNVSCQVDIDLTKVTKRTSSWDPQMFAGGLIGRIRTAESDIYMPVNCIFNGTIKFPNGLVSPSVGAMRHTVGNNNASLVDVYAGEIKTKDAGGTLQTVTVSEQEKYHQNALYYNYRVYNSNTDAIVTVDNLNPATADGCYGGTRAFRPNKKADGTPVTPNVPTQRKDWAYVQGVNFGQYSDVVNNEAERNAMLARLSTNNESTVAWSWDYAAATFVVNPTKHWTEEFTLRIEYSDEPGKFEALMMYGPVTSKTRYEYPHISAGTFSWYSATEIVNPLWVYLDGITENKIKYERKRYYYVTWTDGTSTITSDYHRPSVMIYVYNKAATQWYNDNMEGDDKCDFTSSIYANDGDDANDGLTPETAVKTMARAYELVDINGRAEDNVIVMMGMYEDPSYLTGTDRTYSSPYARPVTLTGTDNDRVQGGIWSLPKVSGQLYLRLQAPLRLNDIEIMRAPKHSEVTDVMIVCQLFDFTVDKNVRVTNIMEMNTEMGLPANITSLPRITLVCGFNNYNSSDPITYASEVYDRPNFYENPNRTTILIKSGVFARIICGSRNDGGLNTKSFNMASSYNKLNNTSLTINITDDINLSSEGEYREFSKYGYKLELNNTTGKYHRVSAGYTHNVGLIAGGQTDGSVYNDVDIRLSAGYFGRVITGNISYGRKVVVNSKVYPPDSSFGRTVLTVDGSTYIKEDATDPTKYEIVSTTTINEVFGGVLGRWGDSGNDNECRPYFYGQSVINFKGGHIGKYRGNGTGLTANQKKRLEDLKKLESSIYGAGSGGVAGLGTAYYHTSDAALPYLVDGVLYYGSYDDMVRDGGAMPVLKLSDGTVLDLSRTVCEVNIYGGVIEGSVYGGGFGYSNNITEAQLEKTPGYQDGFCQAGMLYGDSYVNMYHSTMPGIVLGNIYGSGAGDDRYAKKWANNNKDGDGNLPDPKDNPFRAVASQYGNAYTRLLAGTVGNPYTCTDGDVYGGSKGMEGYEDIAVLYGSANLTIDGATIYGNIYGGSAIANIRERIEDGVLTPGSGSTNLTVNSGIIGNNIFGGSKGTLAENGGIATKAIIEGDTHVNINGGEYISTPYIDLHRTARSGINLLKNKGEYRTFNIYGGGDLNCDIQGDAYTHITSSLLKDDRSFPILEENPNALDTNNKTNFQAAYMDLTFRRFSVYGGGFGENTRVNNTDVYVSIPRTRSDVTEPHGYTLAVPLPNQSFFDIAGGGYSGDVGHWNDDYTQYIGGKCKLVIDDYTFARKVIGGGFYGSCRSTDTTIRCGSLRQVYGGSLLGYVHDKASLQFGNRVEDFLCEKEEGGETTYDLCWWDDRPEGMTAFSGKAEYVKENYPSLWRDAANRAKQLNDFIFVTEEIYGGNDVKGIIGTMRWIDYDGTEGVDATDGAPLFRADVEESEEKGIVFNIYGGTFMGDVYGAGNGHYEGYYVPDWLRYDDGPTRMYTTVRSTIRRYDDPSRPDYITNAQRDENGNIMKDSRGREIYTGKVYRSRPMVGSVNLNIRGNSETDYVKIHKNLFGGGRECTIGQWNTMLPIEDPRRLIRGGNLHMNFGGYTQVDGNVYVGVEGSLYNDKMTVAESCRSKVVEGTFDGSTTKVLAELGDLGYAHWYYNAESNRYEPGFPEPGEVDGNYGLTGEHMFRGYMKNIEMEGDVEVTFYRYLYARKADGTYEYRKDSNGNDIIDSNGNKVRLRKHWAPAELALANKPLVDSIEEQYRYDAQGLRFNSFYMGGLCGSMTNNNVMVYCFDEHSMFPEDETTHGNGHDKEKWGAVYRLSIPRGVTIRDKLVLGSENATTKYYAYNGDFSGMITEKEVKGVLTDAPLYVYEGGMVTHSALSFDLIAYNDHNKFESPERDVPDDFYGDLDKYKVDGVHIKDMMQYTLTHGDRAGTVIYRQNYVTTDHWFANGATEENSGILANRYGLAVTRDADDKPSAFIGRRESRRVSGIYDTDELTHNKQTMVKLSTACYFDPVDNSEGASADDMTTHYGGNIYGGCYNSGIVIGDIVMNIGSNLIKKYEDNMTYAELEEMSKLEHNIGRVFGGGFGKDTRVDGDIYMNLLLGVTAMNVFGGGMEGDVNGSTYINYIGDESSSYVYGSIYGGGLMGSVGVPNATDVATHVQLFSGNVNKVYGGGCMGEIFGRTFVELCDDMTSDITHLSTDKLFGTGYFDDWRHSRLIAGNVYGGNDVSGIIHLHKVDDTTPATSISDFGRNYSTSLLMYEKQDIDAGGKSQKTTPGSIKGYNGFPLVGNIYGGSNSDYGEINGDKYASGTLKLATGEGFRSGIVDLTGLDVPHIDKAIMHLHGGTIINGYGGGNLSTVTNTVVIDIDYPKESLPVQAGFADKEEFDRMWNVLHLSSDEQQDEVTENDADGNVLLKYQIFRMFGGNNNADMAIQPTWNLKVGRLCNVYSGGNFGKMTYFEPATATEAAKGLTLTINSDDIRIDYVYGGGRLGDIDPAVDNVDQPSSFYGATLNIERGIIEHVYGGNDVSGYVSYGTNVNIYGAISGDVYCAGNGDYLYRYDRDGSLFGEAYDNTSTLRVKEMYEFPTSAYKGARHFWLPAKAEYGFTGHEAALASPATASQTVMAINSYRPNVARTKLHIAGRGNDDRVWIKGNVFCGGSSSTVVPMSSSADDYDVELEIGSHVVINGIFMGSNGEVMSQGEVIENMERLNGISIEDANDLNASILLPNDKVAADASKYPTALDLYMRAVEIVHAPHDFDWNPSIDDAYIGEFVVGGNRGSLITEKTITLNFPENLKVYGRIIGGCKDANVRYNNTEHIGGLITPPADPSKPKVDLRVKSAFRPYGILYPDETQLPPISLNDYMVDANGNSIMVKNPDFDETKEINAENPEFIVDPTVPASERFYRNEQCNVYGGCFKSGTTIGDINIDLYSDMLGYDYDGIDKRALINGISDGRSWRTFTVVGGGYGAQTAVYGDIRVRMLPRFISMSGFVENPSAAAVFGGSQEGLVVGNTHVEIRSGKVLTNVYGASESAKMYGSTSVIVGYPKYYRTKVSGVYRLNRADQMSVTSLTDEVDYKGDIVVQKSVAYRVGDIIPPNVYDMIVGKVDPDVARGEGFVLGQYVKESDAIALTAANKSTYFEEIQELPTTLIDPLYTWDNVEVWVGDQNSTRDPNAEYYGHGNIYGGGFVPNSTNQDIMGEYTVCRFNKYYHPLADDDDYQTDLSDGHLANGVYGGTTSVIIWDNADNAKIKRKADDTPVLDESGWPQYEETASDGSAIRDHIHIGTGHYIVETQPANAMKMGLTVFYNDGTAEEPVFKPFTGAAADLDGGTTYYTKAADGGLYGGGRKVFAESFRGIDIAYYGYADHSPQSPKLLNTLQRADLVTVTDCCLELVGASDFAVEDDGSVAATGGTDNTLYAINRIGELIMVSSIDKASTLHKGVPSLGPDGVIEHSHNRVRNYIGLYRSARHLGSLRSNWELEDVYRRSDGTLTDETNSGDYNNNGLTSYINHKHDILELYDAFMTYSRTEKTASDLATLKGKYDAYRTTHTDEALPEVSEADALTTNIINLFNRRNIGTSGNMIGINSGYALHIEGRNKDGVYYGPVYGITELKLITVAVGDGGGYVYALNHHYDPEEKDQEGNTFDWCHDYGHDFLMTTGNFVFPGAAYFVTDESNNKTYNYIIDDCYPLTKGFYQYRDEYEKRNPAVTPLSRAGGSSDFNVNKEQEIHYWYINGQRFTYNVTLTGITSDKKQSFYVNELGELAEMVAVQARVPVKVKEVTWFNDLSPEVNSDSCDITGYDLEKNYKLYVSIDDNTRVTATESGGGTFVAEIPRANYVYDTKVNKTIGTQDPVDPNPAGNDVAFGQVYDESTGTWTPVDKKPRLGIRLDDDQPNRLADQPASVGHAYYDEHLKGPRYVQIVLEVDNGSSSNKFEYVVNLTIDYLLGPLLSGKVTVENCALPGEYIYANVNNVTIDMDENLGISDPVWRLYAVDKSGRRIDSAGRRLSRDGKVYSVDASGNETELVGFDPNDFEALYEELTDDAHRSEYMIGERTDIAHLPAYWYQNGWELSYGIKAAGVVFETKEGTPIEVHNYHRMKPRYAGTATPLDQRLVAGARIYIEDNEDMAYFMQYLKEHQFDGEVVDGVQKSCDMLSLAGEEIGPRYAKGLDFYLMTRATLPTISGSTPVIFQGRFHGNGHRLYIPSSLNMNFINQGWIYNTGFVSDVDNDNTKVFYNNQGSLYNCFYFNTHGKGTFLGGKKKSELELLPGHAIVNCYQNTLSVEQLTDWGYKYNEMMHISTNGFRYGQVAYNLNGFYLQKRHKLLHDAGAENNAKALYDKDVELRTSAEHEDYMVPYVEEMFNNGDYRYAFYDIPEDFTHVQDALRTAAVPNYRDYLNRRADGLPVSMHKMRHDIDESRWCENHQKYHPRYDTDYLFFGENLRIDVDDDNRELPAAFTPSTRVYRVGGFYGSAADKGCFLNEVGYLESPMMTAVDFVGYRDRDMYDSNGKLKADDRRDLDVNGWLIKPGWHEVFMAPTLDVPWTWDDEAGTNLRHNFKDFDVNSDRVTHNLLIYTTEWSDAMKEMEKFHYTDATDAALLGVDDHSFTDHSENSVWAHHIIDNPSDGGGPKVYGDYFHLVDNHPFNAPVEFRAQQAWYLRRPNNYADEYEDSDYAYKTGWEGIMLPFDVAKTYAYSTNTGMQKNDMGEITHFFGEDDGTDWLGHEYWLRRLKSMGIGKELIFERPNVGNEPKNPGEARDLVANYTFHNDVLYNLYKDYGYDSTQVIGHRHDVLYHDESGTLERTISGYRHLSHNIPYIVAYPGERYYEFDLSGQFFADKLKEFTGSTAEAVPQAICYFAKKENVDGEYVTIPLTDQVACAEYAAGENVLAGTFLGVTNSQELAAGTLRKYDPAIAVLDAYYPDAGQEKHYGDKFVGETKNTVEVRPFRVYMMLPSASRSTMRIGSNDRIDSVPMPDEAQPDLDEPMDESEVEEYVEVWVEGDALLVRTPADIETDIYNTLGQFVRRIKAYRGVNRYSGLLPGFYTVLNHKVKI